MRKIIFVILIAIVPVLSFCQISFGTYEFSYDWYWRGHTTVFLVLNKDYTYTFKMLDDVSGEQTKGIWKIRGTEIQLIPSVIPNKVKIDPFKTENKKTNIIETYINHKQKKGIKIEVYSFGNHKTYTSNLKGQICFMQNYDSLKVTVENKKYTIHESNNFSFSLLRIYIETQYKDLIYRMLGTDRIKIINNKLSITYKSERHKKQITEFFKSVK